MMTEHPAEKMTVLKLQQMKKEKKPLDVGIAVGSITATAEVRA